MLYAAITAYGKERSRASDKALEHEIKQELLPGLMELFYNNTYQPDVSLCDLGQMVATFVAKELGWQVGSIDRLRNYEEEDLKQELCLEILVVINTVVAGSYSSIPYNLERDFPPLLIGALIDWYRRN